MQQLQAKENVLVHQQKSIMAGIVHLIFSLEVGGAENLVIDIANEQAKHTAVFILIINNKCNEALLQRISKKVGVVCLRRTEGNRRNPFFVLKLWKYLLQRRPQAIHCHDEKLINLLYFWRAKAAITVHDTGLPVGNLKKYKKVFSISQAVQNDLLERGNIKSAVVYNGIDFESIQKKRTYRFEKHKPFKMLQVSRLSHKKKGQHLAIQVVKKLLDLGFDNLHLYIVGNGASMGYLKSLTARLNVTAHVHFTGVANRAWIFENLCRFDLLLQPSLYEGFGLTIVEALAAGLPVAASDIEGPAEILKDLPAGFLFPTDNVDGLVAAIQKVVCLTAQGQIESLCAASAQIAQQKYSIRNTAMNYMEHYKNGSNYFIR